MAQAGDGFAEELDVQTITAPDRTDGRLFRPSVQRGDRGRDPVARGRPGIAVSLLLVLSVLTSALAVYRLAKERTRRRALAKAMANLGGYRLGEIAARSTSSRSPTMRSLIGSAPGSPNAPPPSTCRTA